MPVREFYGGLIFYFKFYSNNTVVFLGNTGLVPYCQCSHGAVFYSCNLPLCHVGRISNKLSSLLYFIIKDGGVGWGITVQGGVDGTWLGRAGV